MRIVTVPCLSDNHAYLVICESTGQAAVIDPSESGPVLDALEREGVRLSAVWNTHHHWDHTGGNTALLQAFPDLDVVGHASDKTRIPGQTAFVEDSDVVTLGKEVRATVIFNPGHTLGAISYHLQEERVVFTGDTLFLAGCGRVFEGTFAMLHESLTRLARLPGNTRIYCGHEYTAANLRFARAVEPDNDAVVERARNVEDTRQHGNPTVPGTMAEEWATNPFLRVSEPEVIRAAREHGHADTPARVFATLRTWKDGFR